MSFTGTQQKCRACEKTVYPVELLLADGVSYHKSCFKCSHCKSRLQLSNYSSMERVVYCRPHFEQLFKESGSFSKNFQSRMANRNCKPGLPKLSVLLISVFVVLALTITIARSDITIQSSDGEDVDCVDIMTQPAFDNPLLKHHKFQEQPSDIPSETETIQKGTRQTFEALVTTANCPEGTVPIRSNNANHRKQPAFASYTLGHEYAIMITKQSPTSKLYGTKATINMWDPTVERVEEEMSISQIWIASGEYERGDLNTIEVGWQSDTYTSGCYNVKCPGFIQTSSRIVIGGTVSPISTFGGSQFEITIHVWKDQKSGNWWLSLGPNNSLVGYWPNELFTTLADHADRVEWGGEIFNSNTSGQHTKTHMGSGHFPNEGFGKASYFRNLKILDNNNSLQSIQDFMMVATNPKYYNIKDQYTDEWKTHFFYGGPGFRPTDSGAVALALSLTSFYLFFSFFLIV